MRNRLTFNRALLLIAGLALAGSTMAVSPLAAQGSKGPRTPFSTADFSKLRWLEGSWSGTATGEASTYQRIRMTNDSTLEITYFRDPSFSQETGTGRVYLTVGRVYHTFGSNQWVATHIGSDGLFLVPTSGRNNFVWNYQSPDSWTSTMRTGVGGHERVIVYDMRRVKP